MNGRGRDEDPKPHLGYHLQAGPEQLDRSGGPSLLPFMPVGIAGSE